MELLYNRYYLDIEFYRASSTLVLRWKGKQTKETIYKGGLRILKIIKEEGIKCIYNCNLAVHGSFSSVSKWIRDTWFYEVKELGVKYFAWLTSSDEHAKQSARKAKPRLKFIRMFDREKEAWKWIRSKGFISPPVDRVAPERMTDSSVAVSVGQEVTSIASASPVSSTQKVSSADKTEKRISYMQKVFPMLYKLGLSDLTKGFVRYLLKLLNITGDDS